MASDGIRPSSDFFFLRPRFILWRGPRRGIRAANACFQKFKTQFSSDLHGLNCREYQIPHAHEIVSSGRECEHPRHSFQPAMPGLTQHAHRFHPTKHFFDSLPFPLTHLVALMPRRATINGATALTLGVLRNMRSHIHASHLLHELFGVVPFIGAQRDTLYPSTRSVMIMAACRSAKPLHCSNAVSTTIPFRFSISTLPQYASFDS